MKQKHDARAYFGKKFIVFDFLRNPARNCYEMVTKSGTKLVTKWLRNWLRNPVRKKKQKFGYKHECLSVGGKTNFGKTLGLTVLV